MTVNRLAARLPYRPSPTWRVRRTAISPAFVVAMANGALLLSVLPWLFFVPLLILPLGFAIIVTSFGTPWFLADRLLSGYLQLCTALGIELWLTVTYGRKSSWWHNLQVGLVGGLVVSAAEVGWLIAAGRVHREEPR